MNPSFTDQEQEALLWSSKLIGEFDRSVLGRFAHDEHALVMCNVMHTLGLIYHGSSVGANFTFAFGTNSRKMGISYTDLKSELFFWWKRSDNKILREEAEGITSTEILSGISQLEKYTNAPDGFKLYYDVDVWDVELIQRCIRDGIDPEMAVKLA